MRARKPYKPTPDDLRGDASAHEDAHEMPVTGGVIGDRGAFLRLLKQDAAARAAARQDQVSED